jgi:rhamnosyltransferase
LVDVSVILPTRNNADHIGRLLTSIFTQDFDGTIQVWVGDSSDDTTPDIVRHHMQMYDITLTRVEPAEYNYGGTRNLGAKMMSGSFLVFLSTDVDIRDRTWLRHLLVPFADPMVAGVCGRQIPYEDASPMERFFIRSQYPPTERTYVLPPEGPIREFAFSNNNSAIRRDVWEAIPLPEMLKSEDQEWAKRALLAGYTIMYAPAARVYHSHHYTLSQVFKEYFDSGATLPYVYDDPRIAMSDFLTTGLRYEFAALRYLLTHGYASSLPYAMIYDFLKYLGYTLGRGWRYMPVWMRKAFSKKANHWDKYTEIING